MHIVCSCIWGDTPIPSRGYGRVHPMAGQRSLCLAQRCRDSSSFNGSQHKRLPEYAHRIRTVAQWCVNQLVSPYSHVWAVCKVYDTRPRLPVRTAPQGKRNETKDRSHHFIACECCITPIGGHLLSIIEIFKPRATLLLQIRARHPCDNDGGIVHLGTVAHAQGSCLFIPFRSLV